MTTSNVIGANSTGLVKYDGSGNFSGVSVTQYNVLVGDTSNGISSISPGSAGLVLTSNGTSANPTFQSVPSLGAVTSIAGNTGSATPSAGVVTINGGTTGLTTSGSGSTLSLTGTLGIANGGTNATSMSTSNGLLKYDGTRLVTSSAAQIDSSNRYTNTAQPCFQVYLNTTVSSVTGDNTIYSLLFDSTKFDQNSNITLNSAGKTIFTAPVTGRYQFSGAINFSWSKSTGTGAASWIYRLVHSNGDIWRFCEEVDNSGTPTIAGFSFCFIISMTAGDTCYLTGQVNGASGKNANFRGVISGTYLNYWCGTLLA